MMGKQTEVMGHHLQNPRDAQANYANHARVLHKLDNV